MRAAGAILIATVLLGVRFCAAAPPAVATGAPAVRKYSLDVRDVPLRRAFRAFLKDAPIRYDDVGSAVEGHLVFDPNVPDPKITVSFREVSLHLGVYLLVGAAKAEVPGITWARDGSIYIIKYSPQRGELEREAAGKSVRRKSERFANLPLREAVESWMKDRTGRCIVAAEVPNVPVTLYLEQLEVDAGLERILAVAREKVPALRLSRGGRHFALHL